MFEECTRRRLVRMFNWFKNKRKPVEIRYEYNNSLGMHQEREYTGVIKGFTVDKLVYYDITEFKILIVFEDGEEVEEHLDSFWEFIGLGQLQVANSGPYCYFTIKFIDSLIKGKTQEKAGE